MVPNNSVDSAEFQSVGGGRRKPVDFEDWYPTVAAMAPFLPTSLPLSARRPSPTLCRERSPRTPPWVRGRESRTLSLKPKTPPVPTQASTPACLLSTLSRGAHPAH